MKNEDIELFEDYYMNKMQITANVIDPNVLILEAGRAGGKTEGIMGPRLLRVANDMPGELSFMVHKTYAALMTNVWPNLQAYFSRPVTINGEVRPLLEYGQDFVVGENKLPSHFRRPRYPVSYPKHSVVFRNGHHLQMVASDQPESVAGRSGVHAFVEEMKHNRGEKLKSRLFPSLRGSSAEMRQSPYIYGITGVSDTARLDLGEDNWFEEYEKNMDDALIEEIVSASLFLNNAVFNLTRYSKLLQEETNPVIRETFRKEIDKANRCIKLWKPRLADMRRNASFYMRASSFANKEILGPKFFKTQYDQLDIDEFLTSICAVRQRGVVNKFFANFDPRVHLYSDSYKYDLILKLNLKDKFIINANYNKYYDPHEPLLIGYDPGHFSSLVIGQDKNYGAEFRLIKEFYCYQPQEQPELAASIYDYFGGYAVNKDILLYHDRAGNKKREDRDKISSDAKILKSELEELGFNVQLMNEGQATIFYWMQYKLLKLAFSRKSNAIPQILIDENECPCLCKAIPLSPLKKNDGRIELDKSSEVKVPMRYQADRTTQLPSAFIYLLFGRYGNVMSSEFNALPTDMMDNMTV